MSKCPDCKSYKKNYYELEEGLSTLTFKSGKVIPDVMIILGHSDNPDIKVVYFDNIRKNYQLPINGTKDIGNPKRKEMSTEEFNNTFNVHKYFYKKLKNNK